jgi:hypothetical protein
LALRTQLRINAERLGPSAGADGLSKANPIRPAITSKGGEQGNKVQLGSQTRLFTEG